MFQICNRDSTVSKIIQNFDTKLPPKHQINILCKAEAAVEAVETIEAVATCEACPETFRDLITQQKKRQKITFNEESRKVVHGSFFTFLFSILYKTTITQDPNFIVLTKSMINIHLSISIDNMTVRWIDIRIIFQK